MSPGVLNVFVPLNGEGTRFAEAGYGDSKSFISLQGKKLISWVLESIDASRTGIVMVAYSAALSCYNLESVLQHEFPRLRFLFVPIHFNTLGAAETLAIALQEYNRVHGDEVDRPLLSVDCDTCYDCDLLTTSLSNGSTGAGTIFVFRQAPGGDPVFSYVLPPQGADDGSGPSGAIAAIKEKVRISDLACTGAYAFPSTQRLAAHVTEVLADPGAMSRGEYYISCLIAHMLDGGERFQYFELDPKAVRCMGTPTQVLMLQSTAQYTAAAGLTTAGGGRRICFDLDGTLVTHPVGSCDDSSILPIPKNIDFARRLQREGHVIIVHTTRGVSENRRTLELLERYAIPYDEIYFGKPAADFYVGEHAVPSRSDLTKATGLLYEDLGCNLHTLFVGGMLTPATLRKGLEALRAADRPQCELFKEKCTGARSILTDMTLDAQGNVHVHNEAHISSNSTQDYARVYLSLSGLDEIMGSTQVPSAYRQKLMAVFSDHLNSLGDNELSLRRIIAHAADHIIHRVITQYTDINKQLALARLASHLNRRALHVS